MSFELIIYLIAFLHNLDNLLALLTFIGLVILVIIVINNDIKKPFKECGNIIKWWLPIFIINCLIPSEKTMYIMLGANALKSSTIPSKVELVINKKLDEFLAEEEPKKDKDK